jgi:hypothetical protein
MSCKTRNCERPTFTYCRNCGMAVCGGHAEDCEGCGGTFCPSCYREHVWQPEACGPLPMTQTVK